jgi:hypothetical protein
MRMRDLYPLLQISYLDLFIGSPSLTYDLYGAVTLCEIAFDFSSLLYFVSPEINPSLH